MSIPAKPELLAPAGGFEAACAALHYGADAVYTGLQAFSARAEAENVSREALSELVGYAHGLVPRRRVYVTVNTLIKDRELPSLIGQLSLLEELGVDALIVQDAGVLRLVREHFPGLRIHASTQMAIHNVEGARAAAEWGCRRIVLARELSLREIAGIAAAGGVEVEVFIHGALCYGYSGLCLFSSMATGRSGNRGRCVYCCREAFRPATPAATGKAMPFSMRDLALGGDLEKLRDAGVASLKIEGRMKSPLYVAAVVDYYRRRLDGLLSAAEAAEREADIQTIFSRPWTRLHLDSSAPAPVIDPDIVGHRGAPIGTVDCVRRDQKRQCWLRFRSARPLEKHDGIQIDLSGEARPFGFAVDTLVLAHAGGQTPVSQISVPAHTAVEVLLPPDAPAIPLGSRVYCSSSQAVKRKFRFDTPRPGVQRVRTPIRIGAELGAGSVRLRAEVPSRPGVTAEIEMTGDFECARSPEKTQDAFRKVCERLGDTEWSLESLTLHDPDGRFVPVSILNDGRRKLATALSDAMQRGREQRQVAVRASVDSLSADLSLAVGGWSLKVRRAQQLAGFGGSDWESVCEVVLAPESPFDEAQIRRELEQIDVRSGHCPVRLALPPILRPTDDEWWRRAVSRLGGSGAVQRWEISNPGGWSLLKAARLLTAGADVSADWPLYTLNRMAFRHWTDIGIRQMILSPEDERENLAQILGLAGGRVIPLMFQYVPLFLSENLPEWGAAAEPDADGHIVNERGDVYRMRVVDGRTIITSAVPFSLAARLDELREVGATRFRADFTLGPDAPDEVVGVWRTIRQGRMPPGAREGNYQRGLA